MEDTLAIPPKYRSLKFIQPIGWDEVFDNWREGESNQEAWKKHWEERGFDSWDEWRTDYAGPLDPSHLEWSLYAIENPLADLPLIYGAPTRGWIKAYGGEKTLSLADLVQLPIVTDNDKITAVRNNFPAETMLTGLVSDDKIILIEGMHRACALASWNGADNPDSQIKIALARWAGELPILGGNRKLIS